ncbi:PAS domain S-box protein [Haloplanus sp. GCM10025708]|uniref:PAS domain-containing response regulator n=1 Tax=Haloplanus sp. GCM10025708 TaxID=3252679 RepID=UPI003613F553
MITDASIRVLHVDDEPAFADMVAQFLQREDGRIDVDTATSATAGLDRLEETDVDCVVSDYEMPAQNGIEFLEAVRESHSDLPFILFTGKGSEEIASDAISAGVTDYLQKKGGTSQYALLAHRIENAVEQYRSRREIEASQERLALFFEQSPLGAIEWNEEFEVVRLNDTAEEILGYAQEELLGSPWERIVPDPDRDDVTEITADLLADDGGYHSVNENVTKAGERIICEWHNRVITDETGDVVTIFSKFQDITEREERRRKLRRERAFTEQALDALDDLFYVLDTDGRLSRWNERVEAVTGRTGAELTERTYSTSSPRRNGTVSRTPSRRPWRRGASRSKPTS